MELKEIGQTRTSEEIEELLIQRSESDMPAMEKAESRRSVTVSRVTLCIFLMI